MNTEFFDGMSRAACRVLVTSCNRSAGFIRTKKGKALLTTIERGRTLTSDGYTIRVEADCPGRWQVIKVTGEFYTVDVTIALSAEGTPCVSCECSPDCVAYAGCQWCKHCEAVALRVERALETATHLFGPSLTAVLPSLLPIGESHPIPSRAMGRLRGAA